MIPVWIERILARAESLALDNAEDRAKLAEIIAEEATRKRVDDLEESRKLLEIPKRLREALRSSFE